MEDVAAASGNSPRWFQLYWPNDEAVCLSLLERAKNIWLRGFTQTLNDPQRVGLALSEYIAEGDWRLFFLRRDQWRKVTPACTTSRT